jgi:hypothetical protein
MIVHYQYPAVKQIKRTRKASYTHNAIEKINCKWLLNQRTGSTAIIIRSYHVKTSQIGATLILISLSCICYLKSQQRHNDQFPSLPHFQLW